MRRQKRFKSVKQAPRVIVPLSDRKLPKVFKMGNDNLFPPINKRKEQKVQIRHTYSSHCGKRAGDEI